MCQPRVGPKRGAWTLVAALLVTATHSGCRIERRQPAGEVSATAAAAAEFDAKAHVDAIWTSRVLPVMRERSGDFGAVQKALASKSAAELSRHAYRERGDDAPWNLAVQLRGKVTAVDNDAMAMLLDIDVDNDGRADAQLQLGPMLKGTALRDSLLFISFSAFKNQIEFAQLAGALNERALGEALKTHPRDSIAKWSGRTLSVRGVFTAADDGEPPLVLPVAIEIEDAR